MDWQTIIICVYFICVFLIGYYLVKNKHTKELDGLFEIHITVDPHNNYLKLYDYALIHHKKAFKVVHAISACKNNQYMLSYFTRKTNDLYAVTGALHVSDELKKLGINVLRVKVEGHNVAGTPMTTRDYEKIKDYLANKYNSKTGYPYCGTPYFEFHVKVNLPHGETISHLDEFIKKYKFVAISLNLCSATKKPLLTIRVYNDGFYGAQKYKDYVLNDMKQNGYHFDDAIQQEFSLFDTCSAIDAGWIVYK